MGNLGMGRQTEDTGVGGYGYGVLWVQGTGYEGYRGARCEGYRAQGTGMGV